MGLESAGFKHVAAIDNDTDACNTLKFNRPQWDVREQDVHDIDGAEFRGVDVFAGGVPCPPFSIAGKQLGDLDDRDLFPIALDLIDQIQPTAVLLENVRGFATRRFADYREAILARLKKMDYEPDWKLLQASDYGVPQLRPRFVLVALRPKYADRFRWPKCNPAATTVATKIGDLMAENDWPGIGDWLKKAEKIAPTIVGGSKKHGGPDLGPTRARAAWKTLGVDGHGIANSAPDKTFPADGLPRLTLRMAARIQGFPDNWGFSGGKTTIYRQIGNAFPPPVAAAVGLSIRTALGSKPSSSRMGQKTLLVPAPTR